LFLADSLTNFTVIDTKWLKIPFIVLFAAGAGTR
jgi:hypothetical protein